MSENKELRRRILVADDDESILRSVGRALERAGYAVTLVHDGEAALRALSNETVDVIVSDIEMPVLDGVGLLRAVRRVDAELPVILMTGNEYPRGSAVEVLDAGVTDYLSKPFDPAEVRDAVARAIDARLKMQDPAAKQMLQLNESFGRTLAGVHLDCQPIVRWSDRTTLGYECLLRSSEPSLPHPGAVLEAAERLDRVHELGRKIRALAATVLALAPVDALIFVNLHPQDLLDPHLFDPASPLGRHSGRVVLEVTERARLDEIDGAEERVRRLGALGYAVAIDDIGAGYAGLTAYAALEPDILKVDMSLVRDVHLSPLKRRLVSTLASLCLDLGQTLIAEGVETREELATLLDIGCDVFQGYLFARPAPPFTQPSFPTFD